MNILQQIKFDVKPGVIGGSEVDAHLQIAAHTTGADEGTAKGEAAEYIRRQVYGEIEDAIKGALEDYISLDAQVILGELLELTRTNEN